MTTPVHKYETDNPEIKQVFTDGEIADGKVLYKDIELTMPVNGFDKVNLYSFHAILDISSGYIKGLTIIK